MIMLWIAVSSPAWSGCDDLRLLPGAKVDPGSYDSGKTDVDVFLGGADSNLDPTGWCTWDRWDNDAPKYKDATRGTRTPILKLSTASDAKNPCAQSPGATHTNAKYRVAEAGKWSCELTAKGVRVAWPGAIGWMGDAFAPNEMLTFPDKVAPLSCSSANPGACPILASWGPACHGWAVSGEAGDYNVNKLQNLVEKRYGGTAKCTPNKATWTCKITSGSVSSVDVRLGNKGRFRGSVCAAPARILSEQP
ncbi:MAG: hypothetical protein ABMA64_28880 [Myxococcota bacterium]